MKKAIIILITLIIIGVLGYVFIGKRGDEIGSGEREVSGTVVSVDVSHVPVDGPALVRVRIEDGSEAVVGVPSMGINLCPAQPNLADVYTLKAGDRVEARGQVGVEGMIIPCESDKHYLKVI